MANHSKTITAQIFLIGDKDRFHLHFLIFELQLRKTLKQETDRARDDSESGVYQKRTSNLNIFLNELDLRCPVYCGPSQPPLAPSVTSVG